MASRGLFCNQCMVTDRIYAKFTAILFIAAKYWKQPKCPSLKRLNKL